LERCAVAASAEAHKVINRPKTKTDRIVFAPFSRPNYYLESIIPHRLSADHVRAGGHGPKL